MPTLTRWFIKASLISLVLGLIFGIWQQIPGTVASGFFPIYLHLLTFGWLTQLIFGVAIWFFPVSNKKLPRGPEWLGWLAFGFLNSGLLLRLIFEPLQSTSSSAFSGWMLVLAAILQWLSGLAFVILTWGRVRGK